MVFEIIIHKPKIPKIKSSLLEYALDIRAIYKKYHCARVYCQNLEGGISFVNKIALYEIYPEVLNSINNDYHVICRFAKYLNIVYSTEIHTELLYRGTICTPLPHCTSYNPQSVGLENNERGYIWTIQKLWKIF